MKLLILVLFFLVPSSIFGQTLQQLLPNGTLSYDIPNKEILGMVETVQVDLPGTQIEEPIGPNGQRIRIEKYSRGKGYILRVTVGFRTSSEPSTIV